VRSGQGPAVASWATGKESSSSSSSSWFLNYASTLLLSLTVTGGTLDNNTQITGEWLEK